MDHVHSYTEMWPYYSLFGNCEIVEMECINCHDTYNITWCYLEQRALYSSEFTK